MRSEVLVYNGDGTKYVDVVCNSLKDLVSTKYLVRKITLEELYSKEWLLNAKFLVIPGGRDIPYTKDINGLAINNIREFIDKGGSYLGICAGAYFACSQVVFEKGTPLEVLGHRNLLLFKGIAKGSVYDGFNYGSTAGARIASLELHNLDLKNKISHAYFDGGCEFIPEVGFTAYETIATYSDFVEKKAVVFMELGEGKVLLSGVHPEMDIKYLDELNYTSYQWTEMIKVSHSQRELFRLFVKMLL